MTSLVFFLGGHDAEMLEIRSILRERNLPFHDHGLRWGAQLSQYREELARFPPASVPVLVELEPDIDPPENAIHIDHHGPRAGRNQPPSLEQVAELLGISLTRHQQLVAANDRGHIRAMKAMGADPEEIAAIRAADRAAQGVTAEDEAAARDSINRRLRETAPGTALVDSLTDRTSPVVDRLFDRYDRIFIRAPSGETNFFGDGATIRRLARLCEMREPVPAYWTGGELPDRGFFGIHARLANEEIDAMSQTVPFSHHIFMFPFTFKSAPAREMDDNDTISRVQDALGGEWVASRFQREESPAPEKAELDEAEGRLRYSEDVYFHPFARPAIFGEPEDADSAPLMRYFTFRPEAGGQFRIFLGQGEDQIRYDLEIEDIALRIYDTGVGILSLELNNWYRPNLSDILRINDSGRRIYPQFLDKTGIGPTKGAFLPERVEMVLEDPAGEAEVVEEPFDETDFRKSHRCVARYIHRLLGDQFTTDPEAVAAGKARYRIRPTIDDRMFTICWYGSDEWANRLKKVEEESGYAYEASPDWYRFVFMDGGMVNCQHPQMLRRLIRETTYERWADFGTFYGISRYSLVAVTGRDFFATNILREHMRRQYAQMAGLLLAQRASILRFSDAVSEISGKIRAAGIGGNAGPSPMGFQELAGRMERLQGDYIRFVNRLWFTEVTPQEQGVEMYDQAVRVMRLKEHMADLKAEIKDLYEYVGIRRDRDDNRQINRLTILGAIFLPLTVLTGFFGMNLVFIEAPLLPAILDAFWGGNPNIRPLAEFFLAMAGILSFLFFFLALGLCLFLARRILSAIKNKNLPPEEFLKFATLWRVIFRGNPNGKKDS